MPAASRAFSCPTRPAPIGSAAPVAASRPRPWFVYVDASISQSVSQHPTNHSVRCFFLLTLTWVCTATRCVLVVLCTSSICGLVG